MMLAVEFADFGFGTVVGAVVGGSIAILLDHRRRKDEKKRLFLEEKRLMYRNVIQTYDLLADEMVLLAGMGPYYERLKKREPEALEQLELLNVFSRMNAKIREQLLDNHADFTLLGSRASGLASIKLQDIVERMRECIISGEPEKVVELRKEYDSASRDFRNIVRQDLGIDA
jgi:hypothetical protein